MKKIFLMVLLAGTSMNYAAEDAEANTIELATIENAGDIQTVQLLEKAQKVKRKRKFCRPRCQRSARCIAWHATIYGLLIAGGGCDFATMKLSDQTKYTYKALPNNDTLPSAPHCQYWYESNPNACKLMDNPQECNDDIERDGRYIQESCTYRQNDPQAMPAAFGFASRILLIAPKLVWDMINLVTDNCY